MEKFKRIAIFIVLAMVMILPRSVFAEEDYIAKILTDGKLVIPSVPPTNEQQFYMMVDEWVSDTYGGDYSLTDYGEVHCNTDYTKCTMYYRVMEYDDEQGFYVEKVNQNKEVEILYDYDEDIERVVNEIVKDFPEEKIFHMTDMEYLNYMIYGLAKEDSEASMSTFSGELKKLINYKNFSIDVRMGEDSMFYILKAGAAKITFEGVTYYLGGQIGVDARQVIYVDDDTTDIYKAVGERIKKVFGNVNIKIDDPGMTLQDFLESERETFISEYNDLLEMYNEWGFNADIVEAYKDAEAYADAKMDELYYSEDSEYAFLKDAENELVGLTINDYLMTTFAVIKDSSKVDNSVSYKSSDVRTDVSVTTDVNLPLDALIKVSKLTSGEEYERIMKELNVENSVTYDVTLHSNSTNTNITKLENGKFLVSFPVPEELEGKDLIVYYVAADGTIEEHEVTVKDGYAEFETDHFSAYVLAEKEVVELVPDTFDGINNYVIMALISMLGLTTMVFIKKKEVR